MSRFIDRKHPVHYRPIDYHDRPTIVFVTLCIRNRRPLLANSAVHEAIVAAWLAADNWVVGSYVIMPDHLHLFCAPGVISPCSVRQWTTYWKRLASRSENALKRQWLNDCWDTQIRTAAQYREKLDYVQRNPVRAGLVDKVENWPFSGRLASLDWCSGP